MTSSRAIWRSPAPCARISRRWTASAPAIVAEQLAPLPEPLATVLVPGPPAPAGRVAAALARSLAPDERPVDLPAWLWPAHAPTLRRAVAAIERYGGALLADAMGTGKTYVALAVAAAMNRRRTTACLVPAALVSQWADAARRLGVPAVIWSHERVSRGMLPRDTAGLVIMDESHRFRTASTNRYRRLAPWLVGRPALLLSATPVVNRLDDLVNQLALTIRDDALAAHGVPSLAALLSEGRGHVALGRVILARGADAARPGRMERRIAGAGGMDPLDRALEGVERLRLSPSTPVAGLVRGVLWRAAASSPAALAEALRRYRRLLLHARDAARAGRSIGRADLLALTGGAADQLLFWELLDPAEDAPLELDDLEPLDRAIAAARAACEGADPKLERLAAVLADGRPTVTFTGARATVRYLRERLPGRAVAWCTGERAGVGAAALPRDVVLDWFRSPADSPARRDPAVERLAPTHLVATDVAAEGLDLRRAARVVHYDLPWTPTRLDQREGRARRAASPHAAIEVVRFEPPPAMEARLHQLAALARKRRLPPSVGLGGEGRELWRWMTDIADEVGGGEPADGVAAVSAEPAGVLAGFELLAWPDARAARIGAWVLWRGADGIWVDDPPVLAERLRTAGRAAPSTPPGSDAISAALTSLAPRVRERLRALERARWTGAPLDTPSRRLVRRIQALARAAARRRESALLAAADRALRFAAGGHTAGETMLIQRLARAGERELRGAIPTLPAPTALAPAAVPRLVGVVVFLG
ncbi:MAG TPA: DEAD/DEAH box helicase [Gemmatimonadales bacterium]|nr:DEAD/DEAH box helicase [Gemmatimonadales bacterium]